ncbi:hypothetical protein DZF91_30715 [Actinomadura logoneensis]|uniref:Uncharacterized protein n=1 Tax=Actinomadura logoneensis TaxID=2293572 RepID=A0A372JD63_9ACTN|nr:hypothetical protein [Actinomadura logoneensis]RFU37859.1 hypothetical protein DZF91_30715 [Actinomadura logoneensis]
MSDQADDLRARWRSLEPSVRKELLRTGHASDSEARWIAVYYAQREIARVRRKPWIALGVFVPAAGAVLGSVLLAGTGRTAVPIIAALALLIAFTVGVFGAAYTRLIALYRIITVNDHIPPPRAEGAGSESPAAPAAAGPSPSERKERLVVRVVPRKLVVFFGGIALALAALASLALVSRAGWPTLAVYAWLIGLMLLLLGTTLVQARRDDPLMALGEDGVTLPDGRTTVPWTRVTGITVVPVNAFRRHGGSRALLLTVDEPERVVADLGGRHARTARRSLATFGAPVSFVDRFTDTTAHAVASAASAWTGLPVREP